MAFDPRSRAQLLSYLLGELPPQALAEIDRRFLEDESFADLLEEARHELLEAYSAGSLPEVERARARHALNLPPDGQGGEADFSRALSHGLRQLPQPPQGQSRARRPRALRLWAAALAASLVSGTGLWLSLRGAPPGAGPVTQASSPPEEGFVLLLRPEVLRGPTPEQTVTLPRTLAALTTQIVVPHAAGTYEVRVRSATGEIIYRGLTPHLLSGVSFLELVIARGRLSPGTYRFEVLQVSPGPPRPIHRYSVRVIAP